MKYRIEHATTYTYDDDVTDSYGIVHLTPRTLPWQSVLSNEVTIDPSPVDLGTERDLYGNTRSYFQVTTAHQRLAVVGFSEVEISLPPWDSPALALPWEAARPTQSEDEDAWQAVDFIFASPRVGLSSAARDYAAQSFSPGRSIGAAVVEFMERVHDDFTYKSGSTKLSTTVDELMETRTGVCQDFSHVMISGLRGLGLGAKYISGYLATTPPPGRPRLVGADATHAWVACWVPGLGWLQLDPTNRRLTDTSHAVVAWGRDYDDVTPVKGIIYTESEKSTMKVSVDMAPLADNSPSR